MVSASAGSGFDVGCLCKACEPEFSYAGLSSEKFKVQAQFQLFTSEWVALLPQSLGKGLLGGLRQVISGECPGVLWEYLPRVRLVWDPGGYQGSLSLGLASMLIHNLRG